MKHRLLFLAIMLIVTTALPVVAQTGDTTPTPFGSYVTARDIYVRGGPSEAFLPVGRLVAGDLLLPLNRSVDGRWVLIRYNRGFGWIRADLGFWNVEIEALPTLDESNLTPTPQVSETPTVAPTGVMVEAGREGAYIRFGPSQNFPFLGAVVSGDYVEPVGRDLEGEWLLIRFRGGFGWISRRLIDREYKWNQLPVLLPDALTPSATFTPSLTPTASDTPEPTPTPSTTPTMLPPPTNTLVPTLAVTATLLPTNTDTATVAPSPTSTNTPTETKTNTATWTPSATGTRTPQPTDTPTDVPTSTDTPTRTPQPTDTPTDVPTSTDTSTATGTATDAPMPTTGSAVTPESTVDDASNALAATAEVASVTETPTRTNTPTPAATATVTASPTDAPTLTDTPTPTDTDAPSSTPTPTATDSPTSAPTSVAMRVDATAEATSTTAATPTDAETSTPTHTTAPTDTLTHTPSETPSATFTPTHTPTATSTSSATATPPPSDTPTHTATSAPVAGVIVTGAPPTPIPVQTTAPSAPRFPPEALVGGALLVVVLVYVGLYWRGLTSTDRYAEGFVIERCPICKDGHLTVETRQVRFLGIPRPRSIVRCDNCRSVLREVRAGEWRYAVDSVVNGRLYNQLNGRVVDEETLVALERESAPLRPPVDAPTFVDDEE